MGHSVCSAFPFSLLDHTEEKIVWSGWLGLLLVIVADLMLRPCLHVAQRGRVLAIQMRQTSFSVAGVSSEGH